MACIAEGGSKERSAETGQEGLEDVPDYQDSLRQYTLGLGDQETSSTSSSPAPPHKEGGEKSTSQRDQADGNQRKRKAPDHTSNLQMYPPHPPPPHMMPNGYPMPPYHMPPYPPGQSHHLPPEERRNGAGFPPDGYFPPGPMPYKLPGYPPLPHTPNMPKQGIYQFCLVLIVACGSIQVQFYYLCDKKAY